MEGLQKRVSGDWIDLREAAADPYSLTDFFKISAQRLGKVAADLRLSVEEGLLEYKLTTLRPVFHSLENLQYQSVRSEELQVHEQPLQELLLVTLLERLLCAGTIPLAKAKPSEAVPTEDLQVGAILADIKRRLQRDPSFKTHPAVKNILVQLSIYQQEKKKMDELLPTIQQEKREVFRRNFQGTFQRAFASIRKNFSDILTEEEARQREQESKEDFLVQASIRKLAPFLFEQAREVSRLCSTLTYAREDKYKTRGVLVSLYRQRTDFLALVAHERSLYGTLCGDLAVQTSIDCPARLSERLLNELIRIISRMEKVESASS
jgi:hypothetical protein